MTALQPLLADPRHERRRDSVLEVIELFRSIYPQVWVSAVVAYLYVCENEGINIRELAFAMRTTDATASRTIRALTSVDSPGTLPPHLGLVSVAGNPDDGRGRIVTLTDRGRQLCDRIDGIIRDAVETNGSVRSRA